MRTPAKDSAAVAVHLPPDDDAAESNALADVSVVVVHWATSPFTARGPGGTPDWWCAACETNDREVPTK